MTGKWIVDFGLDRSLEEAALYEAPFQYLQRGFEEENARRKKEGKRPLRDRELRSVGNWWLHQRPRPEMRNASKGLSRFIATPEIAKHRVFVWLPNQVLPNGSVYVIARDDDCSFGILHSRHHLLWALRMCTWLGVGNDPRYTLSTTFETFPFPEGLTPNTPASEYADDPRAQAIAEAARTLNALRETWLNPPDLVERVPEVVPGYPDRILPKGEASARELRKRTLTNLYNQRPAWLENAHRGLDAAVAAAYGWPADLADDDILKRLLDLNLARAARQ